MRTAETLVNTVLLFSAGDLSIWTRKLSETEKSMGKNWMERRLEWQVSLKKERCDTEWRKGFLEERCCHLQAWINVEGSSKVTVACTDLLVSKQWLHRFMSNRQCCCTWPCFTYAASIRSVLLFLSLNARVNIIWAWDADHLAVI